MSTAPPPPPTDQPPPPPAEHHNAWRWIALVVGVIAIGLLVWALVLRSDRDEAQDKAATGAGAVVQMQQANDELSEQLGVTSESLDQAEQDVADAEQARKDAEDQAASAASEAEGAREQADQAKDKTAQAQADAAASQAEADQAKAEADAADARRAVVAECAKAYSAAIRGIFGADDRSAALDDAKAKIADITDECQAALG